MIEKDISVIGIYKGYLHNSICALRSDVASYQVICPHYEHDGSHYEREEVRRIANNDD